MPPSWQRRNGWVATRFTRKIYRMDRIMTAFWPRTRFVRLPFRRLSEPDRKTMGNASRFVQFTLFPLLNHARLTGITPGDPLMLDSCFEPLHWLDHTLTPKRERLEM